MGGTPQKKLPTECSEGVGVRGEGGGGVGGTRIINCFFEGVQDLRCSLGGLSFQRRQVPEKSLLLEEKVKIFLFLFNFFVFVEGQGWGPGKDGVGHRSTQNSFANLLG